MMQDPVYNYFPGLETGVESAGNIIFWADVDKGGG